MIQDTKTKDLLSRVSSDISQLRNDIASLASYTGKHTIPDSARDFADYGRDRLSAGSDFAASQLRYIRENPGQSSAGILGGLLLLGAVGTGIYYLCKSGCPLMSCKNDDETEPTSQQDEDTLPSYIS